jgi:hypothetical protein
MYVENIGQAFWDGNKTTTTSIRLTFSESEGVEKLSGGPHLIVVDKSIWRQVNSQAQDLGRSTDDASGEAAGWVRIKGSFGPSKPLNFTVGPAPESVEGRANDSFAITIPFLTCTS